MKKEEEKEEEEWEQMLEATFSRPKNPVFHPNSSNNNPNPNPNRPQNDDVPSPSCLISFQFPGWELNFSPQTTKDYPLKHHPHSSSSPEMINPPINSNPKSSSCSSSTESINPPINPNPNSSSSSSFEVINPPTKRRPRTSFESEEERVEESRIVRVLPLECWFHILSLTSLRDVFSLMQTCRSLHHLASSNDHAWLRFRTPTSNSRLISVKSSFLGSRLLQKCSYFSRVSDHIKSSLSSWWDVNDGDPSPFQHTVKPVSSLIRKMTSHNWVVTYEVIASVFSERADILAEQIPAKFGRDIMHEIGSNYAMTTEMNASWSFSYKDISHSSSWRSRCFSSTQCGSTASSNFGGQVFDPGFLDSVGGPVGKASWSLVLDLWSQYKQWLLLVSALCRDLNYEVMVERARPMTWSATPAIYDKGVICFRDQVLTRYGIRSMLQCGLSYLIKRDAMDTAPESDSRLLRDIFHLLQEADVSDDHTLPAVTHTRSKLRRCFLLNGTGSGSRILQ
ncbi:uncharacterized protein LOC18437963 [Amborella trichopoda]|uniref:F-box domain-containing protein n=1 Tax=Amborella trichopoda TaxID=13333 RepID=W1PP19_AMBTC|nr:uncharacterized protein LOC18437963 [Amborella trichopoda]ERN09803.1 hypothetical protein AMTR_s00029p00245110 [Amborella trichopoda]|eukprot:XP_006848222.1 uncharacterized protein LOC18437963 [Amborella trichopoda]